MDINDIIKSLGIDFSDPDAKRGAIEAIQAILDSREAPTSDSSGGDQEVDIEIDPDLTLPSQKHKNSSNDPSIIDDEEDLLSQIKQNDSEIDDDEDSEGNTDGNDDEESDNSDNKDLNDKNQTSNTDEKNSDKNPTKDEESDVETDEYDTEETIDSENDTDQDDATDDSGSDNDSEIESDDDFDSDDDAFDTDSIDSLESENIENDEDPDEDTEEDDDDVIDIDQLEDILDDSAKKAFSDKDAMKKQESRRIKRERTLQAARAALADAETKKKAPTLVRELEKAIKALEALTEAAKSLSDVSDDEFNLLINNVFDAIEALGDSGLTYKTEQERELQAQEIMADLSKAETQQELSAEDIAQIRAETQAIKAREKEANKYKPRAAGSFKGFKDFLNGLYRAIALQVKSNEIQDDTWSAINRRYSGTGVLKQGQRMTDLPDKKIPVIDFYFDQSGSWSATDVKIGEKAVQALYELEEKGEIKINVYYFANHVHTDAASARAEGGTWAWNDIVKNIIATQATNVVIMTDADMEDAWDKDGWLRSQQSKPASYIVPGYVWYLWRNGENAPRLVRDLKGRGGTQQYSFNYSDL